PGQEQKSAHTGLPFRTRSLSRVKGTPPRPALRLQRILASWSTGTSLLPACHRPWRVGTRRGLDCSHTFEGAPFVRHGWDGLRGTLEGTPDKKLNGVPNALGWRLGRSKFCDINHREATQKQLGSRHVSPTGHQSEKPQRRWASRTESPLIVSSV